MQRTGRMRDRKKSSEYHARPSSAQSDQLILRLRTKLRELSNQQEELAESRERMLIDRQKLAQGWKHVREQRNQTANAEVMLMNLMRQHYNSISLPFPTDLDVAYSAVDEARTTLGLLETETTDAEESLGAEEWELMELENDLYRYDLIQLLSDEAQDEVLFMQLASTKTATDAEDPMPPSAAIQYQVLEVEHQRLLDCFKELQGAIASLFKATTLDIDEADLADLDTSKAATSFDDILTQLAACEVRMQHLKGRHVLPADTQTLIRRRFSEPVPDIDNFSATSRPASCAYTEGDDSHLQEAIPIIERIREWLLDCLKQNPLDRMQYVSILQQTLGYIDALELNVPGWESLAFERWSVDLADARHTVQEAVFSPSSTKCIDQGHKYPSSQDIDLKLGWAGETVWQEPWPSYNDNAFSLDDLASPSLADSETVPRTGSGLKVNATGQNSRTPHLEKTTAISPRPSHRVSASEPIVTINLSGILESEPTRRDQIASSLNPMRCDSVHGSVAKKSIRSSSPRSLALAKFHTGDEKDWLYCDERITTGCLPLNVEDRIGVRDIIYSPWKWSSELGRYYYFVFGMDETIFEAVWSEPVLSDQDHDKESAMLSNQRWRFHPNNHLLGRPSRDFVSTAYASPACYPWFDSSKEHIGQFEAKYNLIATPDQDQFFSPGRVRSKVPYARGSYLRRPQVFSTLYADAVEEYSTDVVRPRTHSCPVRFAGRHWYQVKYVVINNKKFYSQCLPIQPLGAQSVLDSAPMQDWGIIYTSESPPEPMLWERFNKKPIYVNPENSGTLPANSRIYYGQIIPFDHEHLVLEIGMVSEHDLQQFLLPYVGV